jgi:hypothetical protein
MNDTPKRRGRPAKVMAAPLDRLASLTQREKALSMRAKERKRYTLDMPVDMYEELIGRAESLDMNLPDVVRACIKTGLTTLGQFGQPSDYLKGQLNPPTQAQFDPTGVQYPPTYEPIPLAPTNQPWEPAFTQPQVAQPRKMQFDRSKIAHLLPSGATIGYDPDPQPEPIERKTYLDLDLDEGPTSPFTRGSDGTDYLNEEDA